jgi:CDP-paratose 2-epimerase
LVGTINCLELARRNNSDFIFLSTNRVYPIKELSETEGQAVSEDFPLSTGSRTLYGATKLAAEYIIEEYIRNFNIKGVINRCGVIAGPWQFGKSDQGIVAYWLSHYFYKKPLSYIGFGGKGSQVRDLLHVDDLCMALINQIENLDKYNGEIFNIGGGKENAVSLTQMSAICAEVTGNSLEIKSIGETRPGDVKYYVTNNSKFNNASGWKPEKNTKEIFQDTYEWMKNNSSELESILT